ncbi:MAG TPA: GGDEF domain-containing protein [Pilimelia sp.]|nr:GGDEF domain-containing protein [Pilimelia sp.]
MPRPERLRIRRAGPRAAGRTAWWLLAAGLLGWLLRYAAWPAAGHPTALLPLAGYPLLVAGVALRVRDRRGAPEAGRLIDACIVATGLTLLAWTYAVRPLADTPALGPADRAVALAYPAADVLLLLLSLLPGTVGGRRTASAWLLAGVPAAMLVADTLAPGLADRALPAAVAALLAPLALAAAALHPSATAPPPGGAVRPAGLGAARLAVLAASSLLAPAVLIEQGWRDPATIDWPAVGGGAAVLCLLVVARMAGLMRQIQHQALQLAALAHTDGLTGVPNRRAWDAALRRELARARRSGLPVVVAMLDLDNFKHFNDEHGHQAGDDLLRTAAATWYGGMRAGDLLARYGGEEFGALVLGVPAAEAAEVVERLRAATPMGQTLSAGVAQWAGEPADELVARADAALYEAKRAGRNRVVIAADSERQTGLVRLAP